MVKYYCPHNIYMKYYTTRKTFFIVSYTIKSNIVEEIDKFLDLLSESGFCDLLKTKINTNLQKGGRPTYNPYNLLACILYCFAFFKGSLRNIEDMCFNDLRIIYIMENEYPTHMTISNFINSYIVPNRDEIFSLITKAIFKEYNLNMSKGFIDGSKFEANANKYKFVWKPIKFHNNLSDKIRILLTKYSIDRAIPNKGIISSKDIAHKVTEFSKLIKNIDLGGKKNLQYKKDYELLFEYLNKSLEYEEKERICGPDRNSYYR